MKRLVPLEKAAEKVCDESSVPPLIFQLPPEQARARLNEAQDLPVYKHPASVTRIPVDTGEYGNVDLYCVVPNNIPANVRPNVIFYIHGGGWVLGNMHTHDKLVREIGARTDSIVFFPEYTPSPEAKFPTAIEQCYFILARLREIANRANLDPDFDKLTVAGDSVGGNMATVMTLLSKQRGGPKIHKQLMFYPVTNAKFDTRSYTLFARDYYLYRAGMIWFWNQYTKSEKNRSMITASPLRASLDQLKGLPDAMILNGEADVLRDEGEAYARKLREAGVEVTAARYQAIIHDFVMLNALDRTNACRAAMDSAVQWINRKNYE